LSSEPAISIERTPRATISLAGKEELL